jgi:hypothetical protein
MNSGSVSCFVIEATNLIRVSLRRHKTGCSKHAYCNAQVLIGDVKFSAEMSLYRTSNGPIQLSDPRWPAVCEHCGKPFKDDDPKQYFTEHLYRRVGTGELYTLHTAPVGAMWYAESFNEWYSNKKGPDGRSLVVRTPGGDWCPDDRASNCDSPCANCRVPYKQHAAQGCGSYCDSQPAHKCWVRHGEAPNVTVDKNGHTCGAGGGSYEANGWHGFLQNGQLR